MNRPRHMNKKIIIVGAGLSGISSLKRLQQFHFENIQVLEASNRIGGRIHTLTYGNLDEQQQGCHHIELGSQRIPANSLLYEVAEQAHLIDENAPNYGDALENFELVYENEMLKAISILRTFFSRRIINPKDFNAILEDKEFLELLENHDKNLIRRHMKEVFQWWFGMSYEYAFSNKQAELKYGFSGMLQWMIGDLDMDIFIPEKEVIEIDWTDFQDEKLQSKTEDPKIKLLCRDKSLYEADHVIIAVPLGYLKDNVDTLFNPPISAEKKKAIQTLDFVTVNKIFLEFEDPFWKKSDVFHVIWNKSMEDYFDGHKHESGQDPKEWIKSINRFEYVHSNPTVLCGWIWGEGADIMERLSEEEVSCCCTKLLQCLTKKFLPKPSKLTRTMWKSNPLFRGSLVYQPTEGVLKSMLQITKSITDSTNTKPIILFAGDAASLGLHMSTIDDAIQAGLQAANDLCRYLYSL